jgi:hypothetical protein
MEEKQITEPVQEVYSALRREIQEIHVRWKLYSQLFAKSQLRIDLMSETAVTFFFRIQYILLDDVLMGIARMTDPAKSRGNKNLSVNALRDRLSLDGFEGVAEMVGQRISELESQIELFRQHRHKRIAHSDLETRLRSSESALLGISRAQIEHVLGVLAAVLNDVQIYFEDSSTGYEHVVTQNDADTLVEAMKYACVFRQFMIDDPVTWFPHLEKNKFKDA